MLLQVEGKKSEQQSTSERLEIRHSKESTVYNTFIHTCKAEQNRQLSYTRSTDPPVSPLKQDASNRGGKIPEQAQSNYESLGIRESTREANIYGVKLIHL